ncbi:MAG TPA: T9SS type A sorting domain-containing protein, partial [Flavobacterium sp.]|nr:T9SS type A sorting domain-containing protein [Flavobacterium sp.]
KLSPNPNDGTFNILLGDKLKGEVTVKIFDLSGKVIYQDKFTDSSFNLSLPKLSSGMYIVQLSSASDQETIKFIKN